LFEVRERLDPYIIAKSPLSVPVKKPKATWVTPVIQAAVEYSTFTTAGLLREPVFKGLRDDLAAQPVPSTNAKSRARRTFAVHAKRG
jgi:bifunctional non-homologous end joining protein LigD